MEHIHRYTHTHKLSYPAIQHYSRVSQTLWAVACTISPTYKCVCVCLCACECTCAFPYTWFRFILFYIYVCVYVGFLLVNLSIVSFIQILIWGELSVVVWGPLTALNPTFQCYRIWWTVW
jgi:hypothetical protein